MNKQAESSKPKSSKKDRVLITLFFLAIILVFIALIYAPSTLKRNHINHIYNDLHIPGSWSQKTKTLEPTGRFGTCVTYVDTTCPYMDASYKIDSPQQYSKDLVTITERLKRKGFTAKSCTNPDQNCVNYYVEARKDGLMVSVIVHKEDTREAYVQIQKNQ